VSVSVIREPSIIQMAPRSVSARGTTGGKSLRFAMFYHSLISDWNHGNAHFLRGVVRELLAAGHQVEVYEPRNAWSLHNLLQDAGGSAIRNFHEAFPTLQSARYDLADLRLEEVLERADVVIVHEWNTHELVARIGAHHKKNDDYVLLFHDTHHRCVTSRADMEDYDLSGYDGVLAFGEVLRQCYIENGWAGRAWTWHEAADTALFHPMPEVEKQGDLVWIGNWGDNERTAELHEFLLGPVAELKLKAHVHGVRYPAEALAALRASGVNYFGWLPNHQAPRVFAQHRVTVHVPRAPYVKLLKGIPTIRPFEAMACGIPLVSAPWEDSERLFRPGTDYLVARSGAEMKQHLWMILNDPAGAATLAENGLETSRSRHTCAHRVEELLGVIAEVNTTLEQKAATA